MTTSGTTRDAEPGRASVVLLAGALLSVELLAGIQRYLSQTILPLVAGELDGVHLYGVLDAAAQAPMFLTMPVGAWLLSRFRIDRLVLALTLLTILGAGVCALAPSMAVFIAGTAIRALASGALGTVGMGAISRGLPARYRQLVLAGMSGVWVVSSVAGPVYAVAVSSWLGWRWSIVLYLPLLLLARAVIARYLPPRSEEEPVEEAPWGWAIILALGAALLTVPVGTWSVAAVVVGCAVMLRASVVLLPVGTFTAAGGRRTALSALLVTAAVYFGASMVLSVVAHDAFGLRAEQYGPVIAAPGFMWAVAALWCGTHPATGAVFRRRALGAGLALSLGVVLLLATSLVARTGGDAVVGLVLGGGVLGLGMGTLYPDLLGRALTPPVVGDGISTDRMAAAVVLAESVGIALATTVAYTWLGTGLRLVESPLLRTQVLYAALVPLAALMVHRLVRACREPG